MEILPANFDNYEDYHNTYIKALTQGFVGFVPNQWINSFDKNFYEYFKNCYKDSAIEMYICYINKNPIGVICIDKYVTKDNTTPQALLDSIYFIKDMHGKGYAKTALSFAESRAKILGYNKMFLWCSKENTRAWNFYTNNGYIPTTQEWNDILDGKTFHNILFQKEL